MKTRQGTSLPDDFATELRAQAGYWEVLEQIQPAAQREFVDWIEGAANRAERKSRIDKVLTKIAKWGRKHDLFEE